MAGSRYLNLRWDATCTACGNALAARTRAWWDADARAVTCLSCRHQAPSHPPSPNGTVSPSVSPPASSPAGAPEPSRQRPAQAARAGGSAQREYERRKAKDEQRVRDAHPVIGGFILKVRSEPQHVTAWAQGAEGERKLGRVLDGLTSDRIHVLHDRRIRGSRANIDHIVVAPSGIYVVDAKQRRGKVERRDKGSLLRTDLRLFVGSRDCTRLVDGMRRQVDAVRSAVGSGPPVHPVLCFVSADWGLFTRPFSLQGVLICWPRALSKRVRSPGGASESEIARLADRLAHDLPPA